MIIITTFIVGMLWLLAQQAWMGWKALHESVSQIFSKPFYGTTQGKYKPHAKYRIVQRS